MSTDAKSIGCAECDWRGWIHMKEPFEIQGCDTCRGPSREDSDAVEAHRKDCGCDWPEVDYQDYFRRNSFFGLLEKHRTMAPPLRALMDRFHALASDRKNFATNVNQMAEVLGEAIDAYHNHWVLQEEEGSFYNELQALGMSLLVVLSVIFRKRWKEHWTWNFEDGTYLDWKWYAKKPVTNPFLNRMHQVQAVSSDAAHLPDKYWETVNSYLDKIRALGATIYQVHDEISVNFNDKPEIVGDVNSLLAELTNYQLTQYMRHAASFGPINLSAGSSVFEKEWKDFSDNAMEKALTQHAPKLIAAMQAVKKRGVKELDHKKILAALRLGALRALLDGGSDASKKIEEAARHFLEVYPDADK